MRAIPTIRVKLTPKGLRVARPIPRDRVCWYCANDQHARCPWPATCACWRCYGDEMKKQVGGATAGDELSREASFYTPPAEGAK